MHRTHQLGRSLRHTFITPDLKGPPTGGTLVNAAFIDALNRAGVSTRQCQLNHRTTSVVDGKAEIYWVDSLYLDAVPTLRAQSPGARLNVILHYLPSLVSHATDPGGPAHELTSTERQALDAASAFLVTSGYMQRLLLRLDVGTRPVLCVEPGVDVAPVFGRSKSTTLHALMLCNVTEGKGVLELISALALRVLPDDAFELQIAGRVDMSPHYAERCASEIAAHPELENRVRLLGGVAHDQALTLLGRACLLVSASRMESYGMALAEARAAGVPIVARAGGHTAAHVRAETGGSMLADETAIAIRLLELVREPLQLAAVQERARGAILVRSWDDAAAELLAQL